MGTPDLLANYSPGKSLLQGDGTGEQNGIISPSRSSQVKKSDKIKKALRSPPPSAPDWREGLSLGSTLLNLASTGHAEVGILPGSYLFFVGDSDSGKSFCSLTCLAEATLNPRYKGYRFIHDNVEGGTLMNVAHYFGKEVESRLEAPSPKGPSTTVEEFYYHLDNAFGGKKPFIYVLDSMDSLTTEDEEEKFDEDKSAHERGRASSGTYGMSKAKENSSKLRVMCSKLRKTGSILIVICQTRDNIGFGAKFNPKTRSGGNALTFYADLELWSSVREQLYKPVRGNKCHIGSLIRVKVRRSRYTGQKHSVQIPLLWSHGIDDVGGNIDYLLEWKHWREKEGVITAPEWDVVMGREELVQFIDQGGLEGELREVVEEVWREVEKAVTPPRKRKYGKEEG